MLRRLAGSGLALVLIGGGCGPEPGGEGGSATGSGGSGSGGGTSTGSATPTSTGEVERGTTGEVTTSAAMGTTTSSSGGTTTGLPDPTGWTTNDGDDTTEGFVCNWTNAPGWEGFCPLATVANATIEGTTPLGPVAFTFAYFGLESICVDCPFASEGALEFYGVADGPTQAQVDSLRLTFRFGAQGSLRVGDEQAGFDSFKDEVIVSFEGVEVPSVAETNPPLDPEAPPTLSGTLTIVGGGWDVRGGFTATLCRALDPQHTCA